MQPSFDNAHQRLHGKWLRLKNIACDEPSFLKMEGVFYDILLLSRLQESSLEKERLLEQLDRLKKEKFPLTQKLYAKARQRETFICQFKTALNKEIAAYLKTAKSKRPLEASVFPV
jgi:hypothetical protein